MVWVAWAMLAHQPGQARIAVWLVLRALVGEIAEMLASADLPQLDHPLDLQAVRAHLRRALGPGLGPRPVYLVPALQARQQA